MKNKAILIPAIFLIVTIGNYFGTVSDGRIRAIEFLHIWAIGALSGVLIFQIAKTFSERKK